jgi:hypothetical protein
VLQKRRVAGPKLIQCRRAEACKDMAVLIIGAKAKQLTAGFMRLVPADNRDAARRQVVIRFVAIQLLPAR